MAIFKLVTKKGAAAPVALPVPDFSFTPMIPSHK